MKIQILRIVYNIFTHVAITPKPTILNPGSSKPLEETISCYKAKNDRATSSQPNVGFCEDVGVAWELITHKLTPGAWNPKIAAWWHVSPFPFGGILRFHPLVFRGAQPENPKNSIASHVSLPVGICRVKSPKCQVCKEIEAFCRNDIQPL